MTRGIRLLGLSALVMLAAAVVFMASTDTRAAPPPFDPGGVICFENVDTPAACDGDTAAGAASDISGAFCVGWGPSCSTQPVVANVKDSNFGGVVAFVPPSFIPPSAAAAPIGAISGYLTAKPVLGLINNPCNSNLQVAFSLMIGSTNLSDTIAPKAVGQINPLEPMALDVAPANGIPDGADKYPVFLKDFFNGLQPIARLHGISKIQGGWVPLNFLFFSPGAHLTTKNGAVDITFKDELGIPSVTVLGNPDVPPSPSAISDFCAPLYSANVTLGKTMNNPCTPLPSPTGANCPAPTVRENSGYPFLPCEASNAYDDDADGKINDGCPQINDLSETGAQCDNNTSDEGEDASVNDGCPPNGAVSEGSRIPGNCSGTDEGGCIVRQNPAAGKYDFTITLGSQRDADGDGIENSLDVCSLDYNPGWNPRALDPVNDPDKDGLPNECDPNDNGASPGSLQTCTAGLVGPDEDGDCFANRADNCPTVNQLKRPADPPDPTDNVPDIKDTDADGIGDACDPNVNAANGENIGYCVKFSMMVGSPPAPVTGVRDAQLAPDCAAKAFVPPATVTPPPTPTPDPNKTAAPTAVGGGSGGVGGVDTGVGSLSPVSRDIPLWAAALSAAGGLGIIFGAGLLTRSAVRRRKE
jgi:hypothetical protein